MRILIIRGGAIGDFILTLPAADLLRKRWPDARIECLGYPGIAGLGLNRHYFDAVRPMDYGPLAGFFIPDLVLDPGLMAYFGSFNLVVSYIYDPDCFFRNNLKRCGLSDVLPSADSRWNGTPSLLLYGDPRVRSIPAREHFIQPLQSLGLEEVSGPRLFLSKEDRAFAEERTAGKEGRIIAFHPGSGGASKNWPVEQWIGLIQRCQELPGYHLLVTAGEADVEVLGKLRGAFPQSLWIEDSLNLNQLAALYARAALFLGNDSGPGHIASAVGTPGILLFGETDPVLWAPRGGDVSVIRAENGWESVEMEKVWIEIQKKLNLK